MLYTGNGDAGYTGIIGKNKIPKNDLRIAILGSLDESQAHLGLARALLKGTQWADAIERVQNDMRLLMAEIATIPKEGCTELFITDHEIKTLEADLAVWNKAIGENCRFLTPGDNMADAHLNLARAIIRKAERDTISLQRNDGVRNNIVIAYLNRLSSWIYALTLMVLRTQTRR